MNYIDRKNLLPIETYYYEKIRKNYTRKNLQEIVNKLIKFRKIRYKDSIKKMSLQIPYFQIPKINLT